MRRIVFAIQKSRNSNNAVAIRASGITPEGNGEFLKHRFLKLDVEAVDPPEHLVFAVRGLNDCTGYGNRFAGLSN